MAKVHHRSRQGADRGFAIPLPRRGRGQKRLHLRDLNDARIIGDPSVLQKALAPAVYVALRWAKASRTKSMAEDSLESMVAPASRGCNGATVANPRKALRLPLIRGFARALASRSTADFPMVRT